MILPADIGAAAHKLNQKTILKQLNKTNIFDIEIDHEENDILELHFTLTGELEKHLPLSCNGNYLAYAFKFKNEGWKKNEYNPFDIDFAEITKGKIVKPF
jgi:hypothetical protein